ncbi:MAG: phenylalanine--tRNA ligase subunit beta, partial [Acidimicrobiales bacterium]
SPLAIARTSKRLGLRSEASVRFERGVDPEGVDRAVARFVQLAGELAGLSSAGPTTDVRGELPRPASVVVRVPRVNAILGTELTVDEVTAKLAPIGFTSLASAPGDGSLTVAVPSWRPDCQREIDVIEEVARHHGYSNIARSLPVVVRTGRLTAYQRGRRAVREILVGAGLSEAWATSFLAAEDLARAGLPAAAVEVENPLTAEESRLRPSLLPGLLRAMATNRSARRPDVALFEIGHVFGLPQPGQQLPEETENLAAILGDAGADDAVAVWSTLVDGLRLRLVDLYAGEMPGLHPTRTARVVSAGRYVGAVGEVDPDVVAAHGLDGRLGWFEVDLGALLAGPRQPSSYRPVSRFPSADVDLAFVVPDEIPAAAVQRTLAEAARDNLESVELFDVFRGPQIGEGRRSLAFRARFSALDHTLTEDEVAALREHCIEAVEQVHGATLRS